VGAVQTVTPDQVVFADSTSKMLVPGMRLGWGLVVPASLRWAPLEVEISAAVPIIEQLAMADPIERGGYDRHIRRIRLVYRRRRTELAPDRTHRPINHPTNPVFMGS
jgi:GntR family transcriptional regulator/MocR family aminotransferase